MVFPASFSNVSRNTSFPYARIPAGNCFLKLATDISFSLFDNSFRFTTVASSSFNDSPWIIANGSNTFPRDFDIFFPLGSKTIECNSTWSKGTGFPWATANHIQKKRMSPPVSMTEIGGWLWDGGANEGNKPEENHVSNTSSSCSNWNVADG